MKKILLLSLTGIILIIMQTSFFSVLFGNEVNPNLVFAFCFAFLLLDDLDSALMSGLVFGTLFDILSGTTIGFTTLILILAIYGGYLFNKQVLRGKRSYILMLILSTYLYQIINMRYFYFTLSQITGLILTAVACLGFTVLIANYANYKRKTIV
ncbi:hypothetical protein A2415_01295 [candidate division WWE3 bacterium RIFOXYC1_FULL_39_7]|uniref:Uncharacterized protein n=2 Tax=Katanobacteria TaxID=422282 RepID=A0A1F4X7F8_UNCKA|nr:MAG: hypothetical protein A2415_01295 [candidate division WWE3 bacterium RIFOXYC1_FULL_39_7]OGC77607.1 MAG: hypothetical protein A2619_04595 [candidate division WWE3 bacterium RIFOXYD1_FULL_39_9]